MRHGTNALLAATLLCGTAPVALAQNDEQTAQNQDPCARLMEFTREYEEDFREGWIDSANEVARNGNAQSCAQYVEQAERGVEELQSRRAEGEGQQTGEQTGEQQARQDQAEGDEQDSRIVVTQPEPEVTVEEDAPEIAVQQPQPSVTVRQGEPQIEVRQKQPTVTVQMPKPTITIDQPEPEIVVRMPEPDVSVGVPEPEVEVSQSQPDVNVETGEPQVHVEGAEDQQQAQVQIEEDQPTVQRQQSEQQAQVEVQHGEPQVSYQQAEPNVEFESAGEPEVRFSRSGEPEVRVEQQGEGEQQQAAREAEQDASRQTAEADQAQDEQQSASQAQDTERQAAAEDEQTSDQQQAAAQDGVEEQADVEGSQIGEQRQADARDQAADGSEAGQVDPEQTASVDRSASEETYQRLGGDAGEAGGEAAAIQVSELVDRELVNRNGEELGTIERVVRAEDRFYVVLAHGGFLGLGEKKVALPLNRISVARDNDELLMRGMTEEEIEAMSEFDMATAQPIEENESVEVSRVQ